LGVISNEDCNAAEFEEHKYNGWIHDDMMCAYTPGGDACQGDSGELL